jgi:hypothetical protein
MSLCVQIDNNNKKKKKAYWGLPSGHPQYWSGSSSRHFLRFLSNIFKKHSRNLCFTPLIFCMNHKDLSTKGFNFLKCHFSFLLML